MRSKADETSDCRYHFTTFDEPRPSFVPGSSAQKYLFVSLESPHFFLPRDEKYQVSKYSDKSEQ